RQSTSRRCRAIARRCPSQPTCLFSEKREHPMESLLTNSLHVPGRTNSLDLGIRLSPPLASSAKAEQTSVGWVFDGGSGKNVFAEMLRQCDGRLPDKMFAVAIDSDPDLCGLPPEKVITLTLPQADLLVERRKDWPSIDRALPATYKAGNVSRGSMMKRLVTAAV